MDASDPETLRSDGGQPGSTPAPPGKRHVLAASGIRKSFTVGDRELEVLHGLDIDLLEGEVLGLMGASGAGKSTLLHILGLLERPTEGEVLLQDKRTWDLTPNARAQLRNREIGFVFQFYHLLPELDAVENAILPAMIADGAARFRSRRREYREKAIETLETFGLGKRLKHRPAQLSGGERQRVALARALFLDPAILIADEPTGNLDRGTGEKVLEMLFEEQARRRFALLLVTHDERLARRCERILYMEDGMIQGDSSTPVPD